MRILMISPSNTFPAISGSAVRTNAILKYLSKKSEVFYIYNKYHQVKEIKDKKLDFNIEKNIINAKLYPIGPLLKVTQLFNPFLLIKSYKIIKKQKIELIIGEFIWSGVYLLLLKFITGIPFIIDEHNIEYKLIRFNYGIIGRLLSPVVKIYEKSIWVYSKYIFCVSEEDKNIISNSGISDKKILVVPNGIEGILLKKISKNKIRKRLNLDPNDLIILFFGKLDYYPNKEAIYIIKDKILPRIIKMIKSYNESYKPVDNSSVFNKSKIIRSIIPTKQSSGALNKSSRQIFGHYNLENNNDANIGVLDPSCNKIKNIKFLIVGSNPPNIKDKNIIFTGPVRDIRDYIISCNIVINPLLHGSGSRLKIAETIACGKRIISTSIGAEGWINKGLEDFLRIEDNWDNFSEEIIKNILKKENKIPKKLDRYLWANIINRTNLLLQLGDNNNNTLRK
ncbi:MAG: glycosyltransferase family 4 protein [Nanoarchaeota archaeon]